MTDDLEDQEASRRAVELFGPGTVVEEKAGGYLVWRPPQPAASGVAEGMSLPPRELIGRGATRREALESARRAVKR